MMDCGVKEVKDFIDSSEKAKGVCCPMTRSRHKEDTIVVRKGSGEPREIRGGGNFPERFVTEKILRPGNVPRIEWLQRCVDAKQLGVIEQEIESI